MNYNQSLIGESLEINDDEDDDWLLFYFLTVLMAIQITDFRRILNHPLNTSSAKQHFSFSKAKRFQLIHSSTSTKYIKLIVMTV